MSPDLNYQNYLDSITATLHQCVTKLELELSGFALYCIKHEQLYTSGHFNSNIQQFLSILEEKLPLAESMESLMAAAQQGLQLVPMLIKSEEDVHYGIVVDYPQEYIASFEVAPGFFLWQALFRFMRDYSPALRLPGQIGAHRDVTEAIQAVIAECASQAGVRLSVHPGLHLLEEIQSISYQPEEGEYAQDAILCGHSHDFPLLITLKDPVALSQTKSIRKLLDVKSLGQEKIALAVKPDFQGENVMAVGYRKESEAISADGVNIYFRGRGNWQIRQGETVLLNVSDFRPVFTRTIAWELKKHRTTLNAWDPHLPAAIEELCSELLGYCQGAVLIVTSHAESEADRLAVRGTRIEPFNVLHNKPLLRCLAGVDGAVLLDEQLRCHAFGVILDGKLSLESGRTDRGSRYNSSATYVHSLIRDNHRGGAFIFSSDGGLDIIIPQLI